MGFRTFLIFFAGKEVLPLTREGVGLVTEARDLCCALQRLFRLIAIAPLKGTGPDSVHEVDFPPDFFEQHVERSDNARRVAFDHERNLQDG